MYLSRLDELGLTVGMDAFLTLQQTADNEGLFEGKLKDRNSATDELYSDPTQA